MRKYAWFAFAMGDRIVSLPRSSVYREIVLIALLLAGPVRAEIPDYQVVRIIAYQTSCRLDELRSEDLGDAGVRFVASCQNLSAYPDGLILDCPDPNDVYACDIVTQERRFEFLESLRQKSEPEL